jgi:hypothetical protein
LLVTVDRGFAKFDWVGESPLYPFMHLLLRLKRSTLLTWGTIPFQGRLCESGKYVHRVTRMHVSVTLAV